MTKLRWGKVGPFSQGPGYSFVPGYESKWVHYVMKISRPSPFQAKHRAAIQQSARTITESPDGEFHVIYDHSWSSLTRQPVGPYRSLDDAKVGALVMMRVDGIPLEEITDSEEDNHKQLDVER